MEEYSYRLIDPRGGNAFYVSLTTNPPQRLKAHIAGHTVSNTAHIRGILLAGLLPDMVVVQKFETAEAHV